MSDLARHLARLNQRPSTHEAELAGFDCGKNGANTTNCHLRFFATRELTKAWERGKAEAERGKGLKWP